MSKLRNRFKRLAFNGFLTHWDGSGSMAAWREHLLSAEWCLSKLVVPQCECMGIYCGHGEDGEVILYSVTRKKSAAVTDNAISKKGDSYQYFVK